jgi:hypothetical protein
MQMMADLIELLQQVELAVVNRTPVPRELLTAIMQVGIDQTQRLNPQITREQAVEVFMKQVKEKMRNARRR